jgi:hypothetical protein
MKKIFLKALFSIGSMVTAVWILSLGYIIADGEYQKLLDLITNWVDRCLSNPFVISVGLTLITLILIGCIVFIYHYIKVIDPEYFDNQA